MEKNTENKSLVSIITPCYNSEKYLERYFESILNQTYPYIQQIIINDGSSDKTEEIVIKYDSIFKEKGFILTYIKQENKGLGGAINTGLKAVEGEYFAWCDSDNFYTKEYVEKKVTFLEKNPEYSIVRCDGNIVLDSDIDLVVGTLANGNLEDKTEEYMFYNCLLVRGFHFGCAMLRTADFDKVNPKREIYPSRHGQNWQLLLPMFYHYKSGYIDEAMFYFVERADSVSNIVKSQDYKHAIAQNEEYINIIETTIKSMHIPEEDECIRMIYAKYLRNIYNIYYSAKDKKGLKSTCRRLGKIGEATALDREGLLEISNPFLYRIMMASRKIL